MYLSGNVRLGHKKVDLFSGKDKKEMLDFQRPPLPSTGPAHLVGPEGMEAEAVLQVPSDLCIPGASVEECLSLLALVCGEGLISEL